VYAVASRSVGAHRHARRELLGHRLHRAYLGPDSLEAADNLLRLDRTLAALLAFIDGTVGLDRTLAVLSSDNGMAPIPERLQAQGLPAGRHDPGHFIDRINRGLQRRWPDAQGLVAACHHPGIYLDRRALQRADLLPGLVEDAVAGPRRIRRRACERAIVTLPQQPSEVPSMPFVARLPDNARPSTVLETHPEQRRHLMHLTEAVLRGPAELSPGQRELLAAYTSAENACRFCHATHAATARALGETPDVIQALLEDIDAAPVEQRMKPLLSYVRKLTREPARMTQADADAIFAAGWGEDAFHHTVMVCALFNLYNRLIEGYGVKSSPDYQDLIGTRLAEGGYLPSIEASAAQDAQLSAGD